MEGLIIQIPESVLIATGQPPEAFIAEAKLILAARLFEMGRLSSGKAAELCGLDRVSFLLGLHRLGVAAADLDEEEWAEELRYVRGQ